MSNWRKRIVNFLWFLAVIPFLVTGCNTKRSSYLTDFPKSSSPEEIGKRVANLFIATPHPNFGKETPPRLITYPEACAWYGALTFSHVSRDKKMEGQLAQRFEPFFGQDSSMVPKPDHVDHTVFGIVPFELYMLTDDSRYLNMGKNFADKQWGKPFGSHIYPKAEEYYQDGYTWQTRLWIDDMYMISAVEAQAYRATGDEKYIDRAAREMALYLDSLQRPNGLFYHAPDVPFYWGRGNGWVAAGMTELLRSLPENNPYHSRIMKGYKTMMAALLKYQTPKGVWRQLIIDSASWPETSGTGMFTYALITGVKNGWLDKEVYGPVARKAWLGLVSFLNNKGEMTNVCQGTNKKNDRQYYLDRKRMTGDMHGQAPVLWCATALLR